MSLLELLPSHVTSWALAQSYNPWSSSPVMSLLVHLPSLVTPRDIAQSSTPGTLAAEFLSSSVVLLSPSRLTPGSLVQSCHSCSYCPVMPLLELLPSQITPEVLAQSCHACSSCRVVSLLELLPSHGTTWTHAQPWLIFNSRPVMSPLETMPSHVIPGSLAGQFLSSRGVLLSPCRITPDLDSWPWSRRIYPGTRL